MYKKNPLLQFAGIPVTGADIKSCFPDLVSPEKKIQLLEKSGELIRLKRNSSSLDSLQSSLKKMKNNRVFALSPIVLRPKNRNKTK